MRKPRRNGMSEDALRRQFQQDAAERESARQEYDVVIRPIAARAMEAMKAGDFARARSLNEQLELALEQFKGKFPRIAETFR